MTNRRIVIVGSTGMLGRWLEAEAASRGFEEVGIARERAPVCVDARNADASLSALDEVAPGLLVNAAAIVAVDRCEREPGDAYLFDLLEAGGSGLVNLAGREVVSKQRFIELVGESIGVSPDWASVGSVTALRPRRAESAGLDVTLAERLLGRRVLDAGYAARRLVAEHEGGGARA